MNRHIPPAPRGFSAIEILIVMTIVGIMMTVALPMIRNATVKSNIGGAMSAIAGLHAVARNAAVQRGRTAVLYLDATNAKVVVILKRPGSTAVDTVGTPENLATRFAVRLATNRDSVIFTPRGIGTAASSTVVIVSRSDYADTLTISSAGRLLR